MFSHNNHDITEEAAVIALSMIESTKFTIQSQYNSALNTLQKIINTKALPKYIYASAHGLIVKNADHFQQTLTFPKIAIHYKLAILYGYTKISASDNFWMGQMYTSLGNPTEALVYFEKAASSVGTDLGIQIRSLNNAALTHYRLGNVAKTLQHYQQAIDVYKNNKNKLSAEELFFLSKITYNAAILLDDCDQPIESNPLLAIEYYKISGDLNNVNSLHNLALKYEQGEDVPEDLEIAKSYYRKAADLGYADSLNNLYILKHENNEDITSIVKELEKVQGHAFTYRSLGLHYLNKYQAGKKLRDANRAHHFFLLGYQLGDLGSTFNLALMEHMGWGVKQNPVLAEKYYLELGKKGFSPAYENLAFLYQSKLHDKDNDKIDIDNVKLVIYSLQDANNLSPDEKAENTLQALDQLISSKVKFHEQCIGSNKDIVQVAADKEQAITSRIEKILALDINKMNIVNITTCIHRLGSLTEKSLDKRYLHQENLVPLLTFVDALEPYLDNKAIDIQGVVNLIEGISKLQLSKQVGNLNIIIKKLYTRILEIKDRLSSRDFADVIFSATRLDPTHSLFKNSLPPIIDHALTQLDAIDEQNLANLFYALARLDNAMPTLIKKSQVVILTEKIITRFINSSYDYATQATNTRQIYTALFYFLQRYPDLNTAQLTGAMDAWKIFLSQKRPTRESLLQNLVFDFLAQYFPEHEKEKIINTLPVDGYFATSQNSGFILQVDGPSHFLHAADGSASYTINSAFIEKFLSYSDPVISVPYYDWQKLKTDEERYGYLATRLAAVNIKMEKTKWETQSSKRNITSLFAKQKSSSSKDKLVDAPPKKSKPPR